MNGVSLLVALATVGVDVGFESADGKLVYTIRIETVLVDQLRNGSAIQTAVEPANRGLRRFRVAMGPKSADQPRTSGSVANEVDYGWRTNQEGGLDYYVQMPPDRLETLSRGFPIDCQVHPEITQIDKIYVFVGTAQLPREPAPGTRANNEPQYLSDAGGNRRPSGGVSPASGQETGVGTPAFNNDPQFRSDNGATRSNVADDRSTYAPGNAAAGDQNRWATDARRDNNGSTVYGPQPNSQYDAGTTARQDNYNRFRDDTLPLPNRPADTRVADRNDAGYQQYRDQFYNQRGETVARQPTTPAAPAQPQNQTPAQPTYAQPQQPVAVAQPTPQQPAYQQPAPQWPQTPPNYNYAALQPNFPNSSNQSAAAGSKNSDEEVRPWTPLILTTLALFASIGANGYLGWLAWSFFWRFRDAASDLARARTAATTFPSSSIVGR